MDPTGEDDDQFTGNLPGPSVWRGGLSLLGWLAIITMTRQLDVVGRADRHCSLSG